MGDTTVFKDKLAQALWPGLMKLNQEVGKLCIELGLILAPVDKLPSSTYVYLPQGESEAIPTIKTNNETNG